MDRIARIQEMEAHLDRVSAVLRNTEAGLPELLAVQDSVRHLSAYYSSPLWREDFQADEAGELPKDLHRGVLQQHAVGVFFLAQDILQELAKPGRDPRAEAESFSFADDVHEIDDLKVGMELPGIVTNITSFGAFVDIGLHDNGLIHASRMGVRGMADPSKVLKLHQQVRVEVVSVDLERNRIGLRLIK